jgi:hypothetical protein
MPCFTQLKSNFDCLLYKEKAHRIKINADIKVGSHKYVELNFERDFHMKTIPRNTFKIISDPDI